MTHEEKVNYLRIALGLQKIGIDERISDQIVTTYEAILKKGDKFSLKDAIEIEFRIGRIYAEKKIKKEEK